MARYINEDEFIAWVKEHYCSDCNNDNGLRCRVCWLDDAIDLVEEAPPADVAPKSEVAREIFKEILNIIRAYEFDALTAKNDYGVFQVRNFGAEILKLKKKYTEEKK